MNASRRIKSILTASILFAGACTVLILFVSAGVSKSSVEAEAASLRGQLASRLDSGASRSQYIEFGASTQSTNDANLNMILAAQSRNRNQDSSPFINTPSASLPVAELYGPRSDYLGNPAGNPEQSFPRSSGGQNRTACEFSHFAYDDPLVYPGQPGASHLHMYFGNTYTNANTTYDSLLNSGSGTCNGQELNRTGYWAPAMFDGKGNVLTPERIVVYYKNEAIRYGRKATVYPEGAAIIPSQDINTVSSGRGGAQGKFTFVCTDMYSAPSSPLANTIPQNCDGSKWIKRFGEGSRDNPRVVLEMNVKFPICWNGKDPSNWRDNYRIPTEGGWYFGLCTGEFDQLMPHLEYFINYYVEPGETTAGWHLSSDVNKNTLALDKAPGSTAHADWWGGWHRNTLKTITDNCINLYKPGVAAGCGFGYLSDGGPNSGSPLPGPALKYRQQYTGPQRIPAKQVFEELCSTNRQYRAPTDAAYCNPL